MKEYDKYLKLLKEKYPTKQSVYRELINLNAIMNLPKGTEHFMSDLHGEYDAFYHIINNCSGVIREKVAMLYGDELTVYEQQELCTLIYYPREKLSILMDENKVNDEWYRNVLNQLIQIAKLLSSKYTRSKVRKAMPVDFAYRRPVSPVYPLSKILGKSCEEMPMPLSSINRSNSEPS